MKLSDLYKQMNNVDPMVSQDDCWFELDSFNWFKKYESCINSDVLLCEIEEVTLQKIGFATCGIYEIYNSYNNREKPLMISFLYNIDHFIIKKLFGGRDLKSLEKMGITIKFENVEIGPVVKNCVIFNK